MIGIYQITNLITDQIYIGQSSNIKQRICEHKCPKPKHNRVLHNDIKKYGIENFKFTLLKKCKKEDLNKLELQYIKKLKPYYNRIGKEVSKETKKLISVKTKEWWENLTQEQRNRIITQNLTGPKVGHLVTEETRAKLRLANLGKTQSRQTVQKRKDTISEKKKAGWKQTNQGHNKKVICVETNQTFDSIKNAAEFLQVNPSNITNVLKGRQKTCKGLHFKFVV